MKRIRRFVHAALLVLPVLFAPASHASFHLFRIDQVYSSADSSVQYVILRESAGANGENFLLGHQIETKALDGTAKQFTFPSNLPSSNTAGRRVLIATSSFAALHVVTPDYIVPDGFIPRGGGKLDYANGTDEINYPALPTDGATALDRNGNPVVATPTNFAGQSATLTAAPAALNFEGLWWKSPAGSESGWGINLAHQGDVIFATWFTYDGNGNGWWLTMTASATGAASFGGTLFETRGPAFSAVPFRPADVTATPVGSGTLTFSDANNGTFAYTVKGVSQSKAITRQIFGPLPACTFAATPDLGVATNYQDLWWASPAGVEAGWGVNFTHQGDTIFVTWFTYDANGAPLWLVATANKTGPGTYVGTLLRTSGPAFNAVPFDPAAIVATPVGTLTLTFANGNAGTFAYTVNGVSQVKAITRQVFRAPGTLCQ